MAREKPIKSLSCKSVILCSILVMSFFSCHFNGDKEGTGNGNGSAIEYISEVDSTLFFEEHNARNSLDYAGTYQGMLPCADCEGIAVEIRINYDGSFKKALKYIGKNADIFEFRGEYTWNDAGNTIALKGMEPPNQYFVAEERLIHLDIDGQPISGDLADHYVLEKTY